MGKHFIKFKVSRVISSFKSCRSKDPSSLPSNPVPSFLLPAKTLIINPPPQRKPHHTSLKRQVSSALISARKSFTRPRSSHEASHTRSSSTSSICNSHFKWEKERKWHVIAKIPSTYNYDSTPPRRKIYNSAASEDDNPNNVVVLPPKQKKVRRRRRRRTQAHRLSTSSDSGLFSEDDHFAEETETLVSTDSSSICKKKKSRSSFKLETSENVLPAPARLSVFMRKMVPCKVEVVVEGKVRESYAVVKRSEDPYEDFKRSMVEMVVEKNMFEVSELEELLRCFLSLNSEHHHGTIVRAFSEIWDGLFGGHHYPSPHS